MSNGKGSTRRPQFVTDEEYARNYRRIFGNGHNLSLPRNIQVRPAVRNAIVEKSRGLGMTRTTLQQFSLTQWPENDHLGKFFEDENTTPVSGTD